MTTFDYIHLQDGRVAVVVADVVGHGVAAAMFMAKLSAETRFCLASDPDVARAIERLNDRMSGLQVERFITFLLFVIDPKSDKVTIVNAGHMAPVVRRQRRVDSASRARRSPVCRSRSTMGWTTKRSSSR